MGCSGPPEKGRARDVDVDVDASYPISSSTTKESSDGVDGASHGVVSRVKKSHPKLKHNPNPSLHLCLPPPPEICYHPSSFSVGCCAPSLPPPDG